MVPSLYKVLSLSNYLNILIGLSIHIYKCGAEHGKINTHTIDKKGKSHKRNTNKMKTEHSGQVKRQRNLCLHWMTAGLQPVLHVSGGAGKELN